MNELNPSLEEFLFEAALGKSSEAERTAFLDGVCRGNPVLRARLDVLLEGQFQAEGFLTGPARKVEDQPALPATEDEAASTFIGRYKLLEKIGEGGFGDVWMAEQKEPVKRRVALKIIKLGMDTKQVVARFEAERQALALMDHPNIAKVLDAGATDSGRPYFVMELVRGVRITEYCDRNQSPINERLKLFVHVCRAIQHAHQKGIIHRDIKPSNILVTLHDGIPVPKVIDFGIAKATQQELTDKTVFTQFRLFLGTPAYVSPEQAEMSGLDIDTRSDVYSLGVLLYELLTSTTPFDTQELLRAGLEGMRQIIRERQPPRPSTRLSRRLAATQADRPVESKIKNPKSKIAADLDWIVMKCLEKDRARRYETANGLARDIERHLKNEPILARPPSRLYELQKMVRRHWVGFAAVMAVLLTLVAGVVISSVEAVRARRAESKQVELRRGEAAQRARAEAQERRGEQLLYAGKMNQAQAAWEQNRVAQVRQLLDQTAGYPDRGFEWYYWQHQTHLDLRTLRGHLAQVHTVAFSPDGRRLLTGSMDTSAKVWDTVRGQELFTLKGHLHGINESDWSPDGRRIATASFDGTVKLWDASDGQELLTFTNHVGRIQSVRFARDSQRVLSSSDDGTAKLWEAANGRELLTLRARSGRMNDAMLSPDGLRIVTGGDDQTPMVWDAVSGAELFPLRGHTGAIECVVFSPDGRWIATCSDDHTAKVWDAATGKELVTLAGHTDTLNSIAFSADGRRLASVSNDRMAKVWDALTGQQLFTLKGHDDTLNDVDFSPDGRLIATASEDNTVKLWGASGNQEALILKERHQVLSAAFSTDDQRIVTGNGIFTATVWEATTGKELLRLEGQHKHPVRCVAFSPDGQRVITGSGDQTAAIWDVASGKVLFTLEGHSGPVTGAEYSPDDRLIATASADTTVRFWDAATGKYLRDLKGHTGGILGIAFSPDGRWIATAGGDQIARIWDVASCRELLALRGHEAAVFCVAFSPDGRRLATASSDRTARIWDAASGTSLVTLRGHTGGLRSVQFSPDGRRLLTASEDLTAKLWDAASGEELLTFKGSGDGDYLGFAIFSHDGRRIVTDGGDWTAKVWEAATVVQMAGWQADERKAASRLAVLARERESVEQHARAASIADPGAIKEWLVLGPISFEGFSGAKALATQQLADEAHLRPHAGEGTPVFTPMNNDPRASIHFGPRPGEATQLGTNQLIWRESRLNDYVLNFRELFRANAPYSVAYALCYIISETPRTGLLLKLGSEDQSIIYLNGNEIYRRAKPRKYVPDQDEVSGVELQAGVNVLVFKIANEQDFWRASLRCCDAAGQPVKGIRVTLEPPP